MTRASTPECEGDEPPTDDASQQKAEKARLPRVIAVIGAITGIAGALLGAANFYNARRVDVGISGVAYTPIQPSLHQPIALGIVNRGQRATSITKGEVWLDGSRQGLVGRFLPDARVLDQAYSVRELRRVSRPLPVDLPAGRGFAAAVVWEFDGPDFGEVWARTFGSEEAVSAKALATHRLTLRLELDPGGWQSVRVPLVPPLGDISDVYRVRDGWYVQFGVRQRRITAVLVTSDREDPAVADLRLWRKGAQRPIRTISHPISERYNTIPIARLPRGRYAFALSVGGQTIGAGTFESPCRGTSTDETVVNIDGCYPPG